MSQVTPVRVALRYRERRFQDLKAIINAFFKWRDIQPLEDYSLHICGSQYSSPLYLVLDLYCKTCPDVNLSTLDIEVFKVSGCDPFTFVDLGEAAREKAYQRSLSIEYLYSCNDAKKMPGTGIRRHGISAIPQTCKAP